MKSSITLAAFLLAVSPAVASPIDTNSNGVISGMPPPPQARARDVIAGRAGCNADNVLRDLRNPTRSVGASAFCSLFLQPTAIVSTTSTATLSYSATITDTVTVTATAAETDVALTTTLLCAAAPTATPTTCNYPAYGFGYYLISQYPNIDPVICHQMCLQDPNCQSFQVQAGGGQYCNLYNKPTYNYVQYAPGDVYTFFDRDCTQYLPPGCGEEPAKVKRDAPIPSYLATVPASRISSACSCFITSPAATVTSTIVIPATDSVTATITASATTTDTIAATTVTLTSTTYLTSSP